MAPSARTTTSARPHEPCVSTGEEKGIKTKKIYRQRMESDGDLATVSKEWDRSELAGTVFSEQKLCPGRLYRSSSRAVTNKHWPALPVAMATRVNQLGLPSADTDARANCPSPPYSSFPSPPISPSPPSPTSEPQHHRNMFLGDDLDTPADTSLAPSPVPQSTHFNGDESDNMQVDSDDDARDADADADADIDADGDYIEEPERIPVNSNPVASPSRLISRQVRGSG